MDTALQDPSARAARQDTLRANLAGRIRDVDTHEMFPAECWVEEYGKEMEPLAAYFIKTQSEKVPNSFAVRDTSDSGPVAAASVETSWGGGCKAPGAYNMERRLEFMDKAGINDALVFGSMMGVVGQMFATAGGAFMEQRRSGLDLPMGAGRMGEMMVEAHNDWCLRIAAMSTRLRPVPTVLTRTLDEALTETRRMIDGGVRAIGIPFGITIEGKAPCHPDNDRLWGLMADNDLALMLHVGDKAFVREATQWTNAPQFATNNEVPGELPIDPFSLATCHLGAQNYITNLVIGGVFERVPRLRCGIMELGAYWIGPVAQNLDLWVEQFSRRYTDILSMKPSEYIRRNVRVTPFNFEPVDAYIDHFPYLEDVFCFSTDYPHYEGGKNPIELMYDKMRRHGPAAIEKFFVSNADWVMPG